MNSGFNFNTARLMVKSAMAIFENMPQVNDFIMKKLPDDAAAEGGAV